MDKSSKILITGASGLIGSALVRLLRTEGYENLLTPTREEIDLRQQSSVFAYFDGYSPDYVFHLAAHVGGIQDNNNHPAEFCHDNTIMHCNVFLAANSCQIEKLLFPGSACAYPSNAAQPIKEESFLTGMPEPTNIAYAVAKINGIVMAQSYAKQYGMNVVLPMVANTYGIGDTSTHVIPEMIKKFKNSNDDMIFLGTGTPMREFIYADDVASAFLFLMLNYDSSEIINVGTQNEISIKSLAHLIAEISGSKSAIAFNSSKPDGSMRKCLDSSRIREMGWESKVNLEEGLKRVINQ